MEYASECPIMNVNDIIIQRLRVAAVCLVVGFNVHKMRDAEQLEQRGSCQCICRGWRESRSS